MILMVGLLVLWGRLVSNREGPLEVGEVGSVHRMVGPLPWVESRKEVGGGFLSGSGLLLE